jgi:long-chain acyl-CoA synthetase
MKFPAAREPLSLCPLNMMIERSAQFYGSNIALRKRTVQGWTEYTYSQLFAMVKRVSYYLRTKGIQRGDFVGIIGDNGPAWVVSFLAIQWIGGVAIPLDSKAKELELSQMIGHSGLNTLFASARSIHYLKGMIQRGDLKEELLLIPMQEVEGFDSFPEISGDSNSKAERERVNLQDLAIVQYTSGTSGNPKGAMLTHQNISSNISSLYQSIVFDQTDRFFSVLPIHHVYEGTAGNWLPLSVGASITYARSLKSTEMIEDAREAEPTVMLAVPLLLEKMLLGIRKRLKDSPAHLKGLMFLLRGSAGLLNSIRRRLGSKLLFKSLRERMGFGRLRFFVSGGAALLPWVQIGLEDLGFVVLQGYGLSETSPVLSLNPLQDARPGSIGLPIPEVEMKIAAPDPRGIGEIAAKGMNVTGGYYKNEEATRMAFTLDDYFLTGDMGYEDKDGFFYITGRRKSIIVPKGGENVFPEEIESLMLQSPFVEEILVLKGWHPRTGGEEVHAIVYPNFEELTRYFSREGITQPDDENIRKIIRKEIDERSRKLAPYKRIAHLTVRDEEFPKTTSYKIKRYLFEQQNSPVYPTGRK